MQNNQEPTGQSILRKMWESSPSAPSVNVSVVEAALCSTAATLLSGSYTEALTNSATAIGGWVLTKGTYSLFSSMSSSPTEEAPEDDSPQHNHRRMVSS